MLTCSRPIYCRPTVSIAIFIALLIGRVPSVRSQDGADPKARPIEGVVRFDPTDEETLVAEPFRLDRHEFLFHEQPLGEISKTVVFSRVTFPSPVTTPHEANNTVHCEYFRPLTDEKVPGVVVLHILGGDFALSRLFCNSLAHHGTAALFLKMPYYGPRRQANVSRRMISRDPRQTVEGMTQAILDIRRAAAWLESRDEVDDEQLGVFGISLGGITAALALTAEPRFDNGCFMLAGGDFGQIAWESPEMKGVREHWTAAGGTRASLAELLARVDPVTYADRAKGRRILMLNATDDEVIPKACTLSLWESFGRPEIDWYSGTHYTVALHLLTGLARVSRFFAPGGTE